MKLRGIDFECVWNAAGARGFFGEGYWFHKLTRPDFTGITFVSKTATKNARLGNKAKYPSLRELIYPSWMRVKPFSCHTLNAMGLPNDGLDEYLREGKWQDRIDPFFISIAPSPAADTPQRRLEEMKQMIDWLEECDGYFEGLFGLQINLSCPNTGEDPKTFVPEWARLLEAASQLRVPLVPKFSIASAPIEAVMELKDNPNCDAICVSNTVPYDWNGLGEKIWGKKVSPLANLGGGGIAGPVLLPHVCDYITELRDKGFAKPINGGGGVFCINDINRMRIAGASGISLGTICMLRPWRIQPIVTYANKLWRN
jgi:dihydroorotate dehydrogenase